MSNGLIIVESPTKAKTIKKFLPQYDVIASMGHVRDLPRNATEIPEIYKKKSWSSLGIDVENDYKPLYIVPQTKKKVIQDIKQLAKKAKVIYFATDEDREGESISWHILELIKPSVQHSRMVFHEITREALQNSLKNTRTIDTNLVRAQETRRILDRLVGYTISPLLWRKIATGLSAGRVQSVVLRLIVQKERERIEFVSSEYSGVKADFQKNDIAFTASLFSTQGKKVAIGKDFNPKTGALIRPDDFVQLTPADAQAIVAAVSKKPFVVKEVEKKNTKKNPPLPFITSSLQQEANRKLRLSTKQTMSVAQNLYENGLITYMRTDSPNLSEQAIQAARTSIVKNFGQKYAKSTRSRPNKALNKNAQEAHEAIRPAGVQFVAPNDSGLKGIELALYDLIWKRTLASEMLAAEISHTNLYLQVADNEFRAHGQEIVFPGFLKVYQEGQDNEPKDATKENWLPEMKKNEKIKAEELLVTNHKTEPPARYTEASIVKLMESEGIGRPSTYAVILETLMNRGYVVKKGEALCPSFTAFAVNQLLEERYPQLVETQFSANMEKVLDDIASGKVEWLKFVDGFYRGKAGLQFLTEKLVNEIQPTDYRVVKVPQLSCEVRIGRYGPFVQFDKQGEKVSIKIPPAVSPADISLEWLQELSEKMKKEHKEIGVHPETGEPIYYLQGAFGPYLQMGETINGSPKRVSVSAVALDKINLDLAVRLFQLPVLLGHHEETKQPIHINVGRYGPYVVLNYPKKPVYRSVENLETLFSLTLEKAQEMLQQAPSKSSSQPLKKLGIEEETKEPIEIFKGPYGHYLKCAKLNVSIPASMNWEELTVEQAQQMIQKKRTMAPTKRKFRRRPSA